MVRVGDARFVIPHRAVVRVITPAEKDYGKVLANNDVIDLDGETLPVFELGRLYGMESTRKSDDHTPVVLVRDEEGIRGLIVDDLVCQQQVVIKNLGEAVGERPGIAGGAVMPDGRVALIIDPSGIQTLVRASRNGE